MWDPNPNPNQLVQGHTGAWFGWICHIWQVAQHVFSLE